MAELRPLFLGGGGGGGRGGKAVALERPTRVFSSFPKRLRAVRRTPSYFMAQLALPFFFKCPFSLMHRSCLGSHDECRALGRTSSGGSSWVFAIRQRGGGGFAIQVQRGRGAEGQRARGLGRGLLVEAGGPDAIAAAAGHWVRLVPAAQQAWQAGAGTGGGVRADVDAGRCVLYSTSYIASA
jgi:hypothetical protein